MSAVVLDSKDDLVRFLQILAEESVGSARDVIEKDSHQEKTMSRLKMDSEIYDLSEQDEEVNAEAEEDVDVEIDAEEEADTTTAATEDDVEVSLDSIISAVNKVRGGRSTGDMEIKEKLRTYFDRLDETERLALLTFLKAFSGILSGGMDGSSAPDPSDPPVGITMSSPDEEPGQEEEAEVEQVSDEDMADEEFEFEDEEEDEAEDTTPPIKAGETQELAEIRKRVRSLMLKR